MKIVSRATPEGLAGHGLSTTVLRKEHSDQTAVLVTLFNEAYF